MAATDSNSDDTGMISAINVTPFVDVVLVLLVIFMITAPIIAKDVLNLKLPKTESGDGKAMSSLGVGINIQGQVLLNGVPVSEEALREEVTKAVAADRDAQAIISADVETNYGNVVRVIDIIKAAGLTKFAIQVERK